MRLRITFWVNIKREYLKSDFPDANSKGDFFHKLDILEKRWSQQHTTGKNFYD